MSDSWHQKVKDKNRREIIDAGRELFLKHNFINVNIKDVCNLAGVSRVTFYKHFKSIDELIFEVQMDILDNMTEFIIARDNSKVRGIDRLKIILFSWIDFAKENKDQMKFITMFDLYYDSCELNEELKNRYDDYVNEQSHKDFLSPVISDGIADKTLKTDLDSIRSGYYIFQTMMGVIQRMIHSKPPERYGRVSQEEIVTSVVDMIINSVKNQQI